MQDGIVVGNADSGKTTDPTIVEMNVSDTSDIEIQGYISATTSWDNVCNIKAAKIVEGTTYGTNVK